MKLASITLKRFRSFYHKTFFRIPRAGLYYISGRNEQEPALGPNGAGKSSLFDAVLWALTDRSSRWLRGNQLASWKNPQGCSVSLETDEGNIVRTWGPISLTVNDVPLTQEELPGALGFQPALLMHSSYFPQLHTSFMDLTNEGKQKILTWALQLEVWQNAITKALALNKQHKSEHDAAEEMLRVHRQNVSLYTKNVQKLQASCAGWDKLNAKVLRRAAQKRARIKADLLAAKKVWREQQARNKKMERTRASLGATVRKMRQEVSTLGTSISMTRAAMSPLKETLRQLSTLHNTCPLCRQAVDTAHIERLKKRTQQKLQTLEQSAMRAERKHYKAARVLRGLEEKVDRVSLHHVTVSSALADARGKVSALEKELAVLKDQQAKVDKNPYRTLLATAKADKVKAVQQLRKTKAKLRGSKINAESAAFWVGAFREIRLQVLQGAVRRMEMSVNNCLAELGLADWRIHLQLERETLGNEVVSKGLVAFVKSPRNTKLVPWEAWSGGEAHRLRLAAAFGVSDLLTDANVGFTNVELWDEPTRGLSAEGVQQLLEALAARAESRNKTILIADHWSLAFGGFQGRFTVVKGEDGASTIVEG